MHSTWPTSNDMSNSMTCEACCAAPSPAPPLRQQAPATPQREPSSLTGPAIQPPTSAASPGPAMPSGPPGVPAPPRPPPLDGTIGVAPRPADAGLATPGMHAGLSLFLYICKIEFLLSCSQIGHPEGQCKHASSIIHECPVPVTCLYATPHVGHACIASVLTLHT